MAEAVRVMSGDGSAPGRGCQVRVRSAFTPPARRQRIDARRAPGRDEAPATSASSARSSAAPPNVTRIGRAHFVKEPAMTRASASDATMPSADPGARQQAAPAAAPTTSTCEARAPSAMRTPISCVCWLTDVREHAVDANRREPQRDEREHADHRHAEALRLHRIRQRRRSRSARPTSGNGGSRRCSGAAQIAMHAACDRGRTRTTMLTWR